MSQKSSLPSNEVVDTQAAEIAKFLFAVQPPADLALPETNWDLFKIPGEAKRPDFTGVVCGEGLAGIHPNPKVFIWPEVAHIDLLTGYSTGPMGTVFGNAISGQAYGFNNLLAVVNPNLMVKPPVAIVTKVETNSRERANQMFGTAQSAIADAVVDALAHGILFPEAYDSLLCVAAIFIDPNAGAERTEKGTVVRNKHGELVMLTGDEAAASAHRIYCLNYYSMLAALWMAMTGGRSPTNLVAEKTAGTAHVLRGFSPKKPAVVLGDSGGL